MCYTEIQDGHQNCGKTFFWEKWPVDSADTLWVKSFVEMALSYTVSSEKVADDSAYTLGAKNFAEIALFLRY